MSLTNILKVGSDTLFVLLMWLKKFVSVSVTVIICFLVDIEIFVKNIKQIKLVNLYLAITTQRKVAE